VHKIVSTLETPKPFVLNLSSRLRIVLLADEIAEIIMCPFLNKLQKTASLIRFLMVGYYKKTGCRQM